MVHHPHCLKKHDRSIPPGIQIARSFAFMLVGAYWVCKLALTSVLRLVGGHSR